MTHQFVLGRLSLILTSVALGGAFACSSDTGDTNTSNETGGATSAGGSATLGGNGGASNGGVQSGGASNGGNPASGGVSSAGASNGGSPGTGGSSGGGNGGATAGGASNGGANTGGASSGGASSGSSGGKSSGTGGGTVTATGGRSTGGNTSSGGANTGSGGRATGGMSSGGSTSAGGSGAGGSGGTGTWCQSVAAVPSDLRTSWKINAFYQKYTNANGIPILSSNAPSDRSLILACQLVVEMVGKRDDVRQALIRNKTFFAMLGTNEKTNQIPEYAYLGEAINDRARGLGGNPGLCSEEGILCGPTDRWKGESICVHEFAHTIALYGLYHADSTFETRLKAAYNSARTAGLFANTYAMENEQEYWGEGVQDWYYTNLESKTPNGVHGPIDKREELRDYDRALYDLIGELLPTDVKWEDCYRDG